MWASYFFSSILLKLHLFVNCLFNCYLFLYSLLNSSSTSFFQFSSYWLNYFCFFFYICYFYYKHLHSSCTNGSLFLWRLHLPRAQAPYCRIRRTMQTRLSLRNFVKNINNCNALKCSGGANLKTANFFEYFFFVFLALRNLDFMDW